MDPNEFRLFMAGDAPAPSGFPNIGDSYQGGYYAGSISHTANGVATHALIVAPRASGASGTGYPLTTMYRWANATGFYGTSSQYDGRANMDTLISQGITNFPAANFCYGLSIGGYSDWYLPSLYELAIAYYFLKPGIQANNTAYGANSYSVPQRSSNYTASDPAQTTALAFRTGGSEPFQAVGHWSSTEVSSTTSNRLLFDVGTQNTNFKTSTVQVRAFRRVAL